MAIMTDYYKKWRTELLDELNTHHSDALNGLNKLRNTGSNYYDSHLAYASMFEKLVKAKEALIKRCGWWGYA